MSSRIKVCAILALSACIAGPAIAARESTLTAPVISGSYYEQNGVGTCDSTNTCDILFSRPPAGRTLTVERVGCDVKSERFTAASIQIGIQKPGEPKLRRVLPLAPARIASEAFGDEVNHFTSIYRETRYPVFSNFFTVRVITTLASSDKEILITCQIAGTLSS